MGIPFKFLQNQSPDSDPEKLIEIYAIIALVPHSTIIWRRSQIVI